VIDLGGLHVTCAVGRDATILACRSLPPDGASGLKCLVRAVSETSIELTESAHAERADCSAVIDLNASKILPCQKGYVNAHARTPGRNAPLVAAALGSDAALLGATPLTEYCV
jgi:hypothetical protein